MPADEQPCYPNSKARGTVLTLKAAGEVGFNKLVKLSSTAGDCQYATTPYDNAIGFAVFDDEREDANASEVYADNDAIRVELLVPGQVYNLSLDYTTGVSYGEILVPSTSGEVKLGPPTRVVEETVDFASDAVTLGFPIKTLLAVYPGGSTDSLLPVSSRDTVATGEVQVSSYTAGTLACYASEGQATTYVRYIPDVTRIGIAMEAISDGDLGKVLVLPNMQ